MFALKRWKDSGSQPGHFDALRPYRPAEYVTEATREGRSVLLDLRTERYYGLDEVGTAIWSGLRAGLTTLPEIVDWLEEEYEAQRKTIEADASSFMAYLARTSLVVSA
jgi:hypothetical protein